MDQKVASAGGFSACSADSLYSAPDTEDLARRGGLRSSISPYRVGNFNGQLFIEASGYLTATVSSCVIFGFGKDVHDARVFCRRFPESLNPVLLREKFRNLRWLPDHWLQTAIIDAAEATDHEQLAKELFLRLLEKVPELRQWPPWMLDDRPNLVKKGEIADRLQDELKKINEACRVKKMSLDQLQNQFPQFSLWQEVEALNPMQNRDFERAFNHRGSWSAEQRRDCIANLMNRGSGHTVKGWITRYRKWKKKLLTV